MSESKREEIQSAIARVSELFESDYKVVDQEKLKAWLRDLAKGYCEYRALSDDAWMSRSLLTRAMKSIQADLRRAKRTMTNPVLLRHLDRNHPQCHSGRSTKQDLSVALSAVGWALANLDKDYSEGPSDHSERQRRTRTSTRDQYLIPQFTWQITQYWNLDAESLWDMEEIESRVRVLLREWPIITCNPAAESYHKISGKPLRRLIRAAAQIYPAGREE